MLHLSAKSEYAIKALVRLALSDGSAPVTARDIGAFTGVPPKFLEQVMHDLRQAGNGTPVPNPTPPPTASAMPPAGAPSSAPAAAVAVPAAPAATVGKGSP